MDRFLDDHELLAQEPDSKALHEAYALLSTSPQAGLAALESLADRGSVMALLYLANHWKLKGEENYPFAQKWYRAAYENMSSTALLNLALTYCDQKNFDEAELIWKNGVSKDDAPSMFWLANLYLSESRYSRNADEARNLLEKANALGQLRAKHHLAVILMKERHNIFSIVRGMFLYLQTIFQVLRVAYRNPTSNRLR